MEKQRSSNVCLMRRLLSVWLGVSFCCVAAEELRAPVNLSKAEALRIGKKIWQNKCDGTIAGLTSWNEGKNFASLGIGHFIWYPEGVRGPFEESFPKFLSFARDHRA